MRLSRMGEDNMKDFRAGYKRWLILLVFVVTAGFHYSCARSEETMSLQTEADEAALETEALPTEESTSPLYVVHICGEVRNPGVYQMEAGQRLYELVELAGGYTEAAAADYLNLAQAVSDGMKIIVPDRDQLLQQEEDPYGSEGQPEGNGKVNLNTATKEQLMTLTGIGEARAGDIIRYREEKGNFMQIEDIMNISGIKEAAFQKIKDDITV